MTNFDHLFEDLKEKALIFNGYIENNLNIGISDLSDAASHLFKAGGKRIRPYLLLQSYLLALSIDKELKENIENVIPLAVSVEIMHTFSLIHDDIMDNDDIRRGVPTVHEKWNTTWAILAGDILFSKIFTIIHNSHLEPSKISAISLELGKVCSQICEGQALDIQFERKKISEISIDEYFKMIKLKTGALFKSSCKIGGLAAISDSKHLESLQEYGEKLGIAFQLVDDILGLVGEEKELGKSVGIDIRENKKTYIVLKSMELLEKHDFDKLKKILRTPRELKFQSDIDSAIKIIERSGSIDSARDLVKKYTNEAIKALEIFPDSPAKQALIDLAQYGTTRVV